MKTLCSRSTHAPGFSLVELILGLLVIAFIVGLLLPVMSSAREKAESMRCVQNLRSNGQITLRFFTENNGKFFTAQSWFRQDMTIRGALGAPNGANFLQDTILTCPTVKKAHPHLFPRDMNQCYAKNFFLNVYHTSSTYASLPEPPPSGGPGNLKNVPNLSAMWMFTDSGHIGVAGGGQICPEWRRQESTPIGFLHNKRRNTVFMDGHIQSLTREEWENPRNVREFWGDMTL